MTQFLVEHTHTNETCPARSVEGVKMMGDLVLGQDHARNTGVRFLSDYLIRGKHRLLLIIEANSLQNAENYAKPFQRVGETEVHELTHCEAVMQEVLGQTGRGEVVTGCGSPIATYAE